MAWLIIARAAVATVGFVPLRRWLESARPGRPSAPDWPSQVRRAVNRAARTVPGSSCLMQAIAAYRLVRMGGHPAELTIGIARGTAAEQAPPLAAHAWVRSGAVVVTGDEELARFTALARFGGGG